MIRPRRCAPVIASAIVAIVIFGAVGCATEPGNPASTTAPPRDSQLPRDSQPPSVVPVPVSLASIMMSGTALTLVGSDAARIQQIAYSSDPVAAVAALTAAIGETPTVETLVATTCSRTQKRISWGDGLTVTYNTEPVAGVASSFVVRSDAARTPGGVHVTDPTGFGVGDPIASLIAATPGIKVVGQGTDTHSGIQAYFGLDANGVGGVAISEGKIGLIRLLNAPVGVSQDC